MLLTEEQIKEINKNTPYDQGVFREPNGIPVHIKEPVVYLRYETGGYSGGSCWDDSDPQPYISSKPEPNWEALDKVLAIVYPDISYLKYKAITGIIHTNEETEYEYYGNSTDYMVKYIKLSELEELIKGLKY